MHAGLASRGAPDSASRQSSSGIPGTTGKLKRLTQLYNALDTNGTGAVTQGEFMKAFSTVTLSDGRTVARLNNVAVPRVLGIDANVIWSQIDPTGVGTLTRQQFISGMSADILDHEGQASHRVSVAQAVSALTSNANAGVVPGTTFNTST